VTALPHSGSGGDGRKAVQFGKEDVGALCAMLGADGTSSAEGYIAGFGSGADGSGMVGNNAVRRFAGLAGSHNGSSVMRLPKAIAMFASRACRGSIMIGTALSDKDQKKILNKLDGTDDPWNCAHGCTTMCHVSCLSKQLKDDDDELTLHDTAGGSSEDC
jgi:DNA mismatch repair protein PMS2